MKEIQYYVLFSNHDSGLRLKRELKELGVRAVIAPTPRILSKCCGISLLIEEKDAIIVENCALENKIEILGIRPMEKDMDPKRDRYC